MTRTSCSIPRPRCDQSPRGLLPRGGWGLCGRVNQALHTTQLGVRAWGLRGHAPFPSGLWVTELLLFTSDLQKRTPFLSELGTLEGCNY